jgi:putative SOS response-associated peptidase YedK
MLWTMAMLTVNAEDHRVMKRFHKPGDEKRMVVILDPSEYVDWLTCPAAEATKFFRQWQGPLETMPREGPNTAAPKRRSSPPPGPDAAGDMFG